MFRSQSPGYSASSRPVLGRLQDTLTRLLWTLRMEKRKCQRFPVMLPAVFLGERSGGGMVLDVSLEGCRIRSAMSMHKGDYVRVRIDLIGETLTGDLAVVRWSREDVFGVELIRLAQDQQARLRGFINLFSGTPEGESAPGATDVAKGTHR